MLCRLAEGVQRWLLLCNNAPWSFYASYPPAVSNGSGCVPVFFTWSVLQSRSSNHSLISEDLEINPKSITGISEGNNGLLEHTGAFSYLCLKTMFHKAPESLPCLNKQMRLWSLTLVCRAVGSVFGNTPVLPQELLNILPIYKLFYPFVIILISLKP